MSEAKEQSHHFIPPLWYYVGTFIALLALTFLTVAVSRMDFQGLNLIITIGIAVVKAALVALFFMGLRWDKGFNVIVLIAAFLFFGIFAAFTVADFATRGTPNPIEAGYHDIKSPVKLISE